MHVRWLAVGILRQGVTLSRFTCALTRESAPILVRCLGVGILRQGVAISGITCAFTRGSAPLPVRWLGVCLLRHRKALSGNTCAPTRGSASPATLRGVGTLLQKEAPSVLTPSASTRDSPGCQWEFCFQSASIFLFIYFSSTAHLCAKKVFSVPL